MMPESLIELLKRTDPRLSSSDAARLLSVIGSKVGALERQVLDHDNVIFELRAELEACRRERGDANKIAAAAKFQNERLVEQVHKLREEARRFAETCICPACKECQ